MKSIRTLREGYGEILNKLVKAVEKKLNNSLPTLGESGLEVSHFITEPRNFTEVIRLPTEVKKYWLK